MVDTTTPNPTRATFRRRVAHLAPALVVLLGLKSYLWHLLADCGCAPGSSPFSLTKALVSFADFAVTLLLTLVCIVLVLRHRASVGCGRCAALRGDDLTAGRARHRLALRFSDRRSLWALCLLAVAALVVKTVVAVPHLVSQSLLLAAFVLVSMALYAHLQRTIYGLAAQ